MAYPTFSRAHLQTLADEADMHAAVTGIAQQVIRDATAGGTRTVVGSNCQYRRFKRDMCSTSRKMTDVELVRFIELLQERFPDCTVEHRESTRLDGTVESGIVIDWS